MRRGAIDWRARNAPVSVERSSSNGPSSHGVLTSAAGARPFDDASVCPGAATTINP